MAVHSLVKGSTVLLVLQYITVLLLYRDIWEKKPLLIHRHSSEHNDNWFSTKEMDRILHEVPCFSHEYSV